MGRSSGRERGLGPSRFGAEVSPEGSSPSGGGGAPLEASTASGLSRRLLLQRAGLVGAGAMLAQAGLLDEAFAQSATPLPPDPLTLDTFRGFAALIVPGNDEHSVAQGESTDEDGGIAAEAPEATIFIFDNFVPAPVLGPEFGAELAASQAIAMVFNAEAVEVSPAAASPDPAHPSLLSPFSRLSLAEKAEVFQRLERDPATKDTQLRQVVSILPGAIGFSAFSEFDVYGPGSLQPPQREAPGADPLGGARPVGWGLCQYSGVDDGRDEFKGYLFDQRRVENGGYQDPPPRGSSSSSGAETGPSSAESSDGASGAATETPSKPRRRRRRLRRRRAERRRRRRNGR